MSRRLGVAIVALLLGQAAPAATTDISTSPLFTSSPTAVKPNIMYILDDSGSMAGDYLPDEVPGGLDGGNNYNSYDAYLNTAYGSRSSQCNGLAFAGSQSQAYINGQLVSSAITYALPLDATGTKLASATAYPPLQTAGLTNIRSFTAPASLTVISSGNTPTLTLATGSTATAVGAQVVLYDRSQTNRSPGSSTWMYGTVTSWSGSSVVINVQASNGNGTISSTNLRIGDGTPWVYYSYKGAQAPMSNAYTSAGVDTSTTFYRECFSTVGSTPGSGVFTAQGISPLSNDAQNYMNWWQYYHTRILTMQSSMSIAFSDLDAKYRVGFTKISNPDVSGAGTFLDIADFGSTQKSAFYSRLNGASPGGSTPLRGALSRVGQYFADKAPLQRSDPIQYSCQKNFTILSTDGYWNTGSEVAGSGASSNYGPYQLDNVTAVGQQDGAAPRPLFDGGSSNVTTVDRWTVSTPTSDQIVQQPRQTQTITSQTATLTATPFQSTTTKTNALAATQTGSAITNTTVAHAGSTVTVTTSAPSGLQVGDSVTVSGVVAGNANNSSRYNGTFQVTSVVGNTYTYTAGSTPSNSGVTSSGTTTASLCHGTSKAYTQTTTKVDNAHVNKTTTYFLKTDLFTTQTENLVQTVTNHSRTVVTINGSLYSDTGDVVGSSSTQTTHPTLPNINVSSSTSGPLTSTQAQADGTLNSTSSTANLGCLANPPANPAPTTGAPSTTTPVVSTTTATLTDPGTSNNGPAVTIAGTTVASQSATTTTTTTTAGGGSSNSLADVAMYYYVNPLRSASLNNCTGALGTGTTVCYDPDPVTGHGGVSPVGRDVATWQHMTTFTIGLGAGSTLTYDPNYLSQTSGDFYKITQGTLDWPVPAFTGNGGPTNVDDMWHAAVDGRGQYFSARDPNSLVRSLNTALNAIKAISGTAAAAATSTLQPVGGNNQIFLPSFTSAEWTGDLLALTIDPTSGAISDPKDATWSAQKQLDAMAPSARKVYYFKKNVAANTGTLNSFSYANLTSDGLNTYFDNFCTKPGLSGAAPSQCAALALVPASLTAANLGSNLVSYLIGTDFAGIYRDHTHKLGDIVNGSPVFLGAPPFLYTESSYTSFAADPLGPLGSNTNSGVARPGVVYAPANDGMLHAFDGKTGDEKWAYIPSFVLPNLYKLADTALTNNHQAYVDASPTSGDIFVGGKWKSILVGGLGAGGRGYYALDVTDPDNPKALWEFTDTDLGLTFGNPIITKLKNGTWVVVFASGYNNVSSGDGNGHLYVLNANTGALMTNAAGSTLKLPTYTAGTTPAGTVTTPSGLAKINAWVDSPIDNTAKRFYGGDLLGNLWRFDVDNLVSPNGAALPLAKFQVGGVPQPITIRPELAEISANGGTRDIVLVATGEYLGTSDLSTTGQQSIYAVQDKLTASGLGDVRAGGTLVTQTLTGATGASGARIRTASSNAVDWSLKNGWMVDLPSAGERVNVDMVLQFDTLAVASNIPSSDACTVGGESWLYQLSLSNGSNISSAADKAAGVWKGATLTTGLGFAQLRGGSDGSSVGEFIRTTTKGLDRDPVNQSGGTLGKARRTSWRELAN